VTAAAILVIDDERGIRALCKDVLGRAGHDVEVAENAAAAIAAVGRRRFDLVLCDINLPDQDGISLLPKLLASGTPAPPRVTDQVGGGPWLPPTVLIITAFPSIDTAVRGMKLGARDYIGKPFSPDELRLVVARALDEDALRRQNRALRERLAYGDLVGDSAPMQSLRKTIDKVAPSAATALVTGESGTGKELVARALHYASERAQGPFVPVNCGALVDNLLDSELFGHVRGAFTGADQHKRGLFVAADGGTLFLDEIGELPLALQPKLLRALQDGEVKPVGGVEATRVDVRVVAATNRDLGEAVGGGKFREDLYYRLAVITIDVPPLRARRGDIAALARHFADAAAVRARRGRVELSAGAMAWLEAQAWPGNVRELENAVERAVVLAADANVVLEEADFKPRGSVPASAPAAAAWLPGDHVPTLDELERAHILRVLEQCEGQKTKAAALLGINRTTLWKKLRQYGIE
jgi:DNA-binding NtrC family response regulator